MTVAVDLEPHSFILAIAVQVSIGSTSEALSLSLPPSLFFTVVDVVV
jgi:hypothetical protein